MKLRIQGNSLRLRVSEAEVAQLEKTGRLGEVLTLGPLPEQGLHYVLLVSSRHQTMEAHFADNTITVFLPQQAAVQWINSNQNGLEQVIENGAGPNLRLLVEKDLDCRH
ncbi:MAG: DUF7009 family protein [Adhaeribacter sp.]